MFNRLICLLFLLLLSLQPFAQSKIELKGIILDKETQRLLQDANVILSGIGGQTSSVDGQFSFQVEAGEYQLIVSHTGYEDYSSFVKLFEDTEVRVLMGQHTEAIKEIEIQGNRADFVKNVIPGMQSIEHKELLSQPAVMGVPDVINVIQKGTGVSSVSEGISGIYVRGGGAGQNLILYDNIELVDPSHLLGTYSAFNPYQVERVELYKGNSPVQYAGRLSSSIVVSSFDDLDEQPLVTANIGTLASSFSFAKQKGNWGILLGGRRTQLELYQQVARKIKPESESFLTENNYHFYDHNGKLFFNNKKHDYLSLSWYLGADDLSYGAAKNVNLGIDWTNKGAALTWRHTKSSYSTQTVLGYTNYAFEFNGELLGYVADFNSTYHTAYIKQQINKDWGNHVLTGVFDLHYYDVTPQSGSFASETQNYEDIDRFKSLEASFSLADNWEVVDNLSLYYGLRVNYFSPLETRDYYSLDGGDTIVLSYDNDELSQRYLTISPQLFLTWERPKDLSYKLAYSYNAQNVHRGSLATLPLPADLWITSTRLLKPEYAHLSSLGAYKTIGDFDFSIEAYGKLMDNILLFEPNIAGELKLNFEDNFKVGRGYSAGVELLVRKNSGRLNGWAAYTLSKSRKYIEGLNDNKWFDAKYDRIHDLSVVLNYELNKRWNLSSSFVLASGNKTTVPAGRYLMMGYVMNDYDDINGFRIPLYHRLDMSVNYHFEPRFFEESFLTLSVINVYNRKNTYFFFYEMRGDLDLRDLTVDATQFSLFPVLPSLSWTFKF